MSSGISIYPKNPNLVNIDPSDIYSVTDLSQNIKYFFSASPQFNGISLKGEISDFVQAASGHVYFNLKDEQSVIACAFFKKNHMNVISDLCDGLEVVAMGSLMIFVPRSQYQLNIKRIIPIGDGIESTKLNQLREKLEKEDLFNQNRKKPIPVLPRKIGVITSKDSVAINDILTVVNTRCPQMNLVMAYVTLHGNGAPENIIQAMLALEKINDVDVIIMARGGGPSDDFVSFNDEELVRKIASSIKPVVTGIGHEGDLCLADLAADFRASTPSTAAKAAVPDIKELEKNLRSLTTNLNRSYNAYLLKLKIRDNEVELSKKEEVIMKAKDSGKSDLLKFKAIFVVLIALIVIILFFLLKG